jgi:hypothetical protein
MTSKPAAFISRALLVMAMVGEGFTLSSAWAIKPMLVSWKLVERRRKAPSRKRAHPKRGRPLLARLKAETRNGAGKTRAVRQSV